MSYEPGRSVSRKEMRWSISSDTKQASRLCRVSLLCMYKTKKWPFEFEKKICWWSVLKIENIHSRKLIKNKAGEIRWMCFAVHSMQVYLDYSHCSLKLIDFLTYSKWNIWNRKLTSCQWEFQVTVFAKNNSLKEKDVWIFFNLKVNQNTFSTFNHLSVVCYNYSEQLNCF